jgi:hypothetical protein
MNLAHDGERDGFSRDRTEIKPHRAEQAVLKRIGGGRLLDSA